MTSSSANYGRMGWLTLPFRQSRNLSVLIGGGLIALIATIDWLSAYDVPLGFLYPLPMLIVGRVLQPWQTLCAATVCTYLADRFDSYPWNLRTGLPRDFVYYIAFTATGLFVYYSARNREVILRQVTELKEESLARLQAEQQLAALIETSPAAIVTTDLDGLVVAANHAAHRLLAVEPQTLVGQHLPTYFPPLQRVLQQARSRPTLRTVLQSRGVRSTKEAFLAEVCFSAYNTAFGPRFTAMIFDSSDDFRSREEAGLHQILVSSRLAVSAMSHEIRNVSGAIAAVHGNLRSRAVLKGDQDFDALGNLVIALERIATIDLTAPNERLSEVSLIALLDDLKIVITPSLEERTVAVTWSVDPDLPSVWADPASLMQVFLNLTNNSVRALSTSSERRMTVSARQVDRTVLVDVEDSGGGIDPSVILFRPFQPGAQQSGLGLYLARAFARSFGGDLQHIPVPGGARFSVTLEAVGER